MVDESQISKLALFGPAKLPLSLSGFAVQHCTANRVIGGSRRQCLVADLGHRASEVIPLATILFQKIARFIPHTKPTPPDESDTTGPFQPNASTS
jgi:hypothetical protein